MEDSREVSLLGSLAGLGTIYGVVTGNPVPWRATQILERWRTLQLDPPDRAELKSDSLLGILAPLGNQIAGCGRPLWKEELETVSGSRPGTTRLKQPDRNSANSPLDD